ncbi:MAG: type II toxin-antitoxin system VapC family toxin [Planctomycetes bacterium]|nr:type II toxin-antitoxin system VapC family toxin [Planctomycetota bacterium]
MIVVDASALLEVLLRTKLGLRLEERMGKGDPLWNVPCLVDTEVLQVLRRLVRAGEITAARAEAVVQDLGGLDLVRHAHDELTARVWELRHNLTAYDATWLALAEALGATFVTCDRVFEKVSGRRAEAEVFR